jgi:hypothetical protein
MSRYLSISLLCFSALMLMACGSKPSPHGSTSATVAPTIAATTQSSSASNAASGAAAGAAAAAALNGKFCSDWKQGSAKTPPLGGASAAPVAAPPADLKASTETTAAFMKALADQAPAEVKPDFLVLSKFWVDYAALMARNNYDFMRLATDPDFEKVTSGSASMEKAQTNIQAWVAKSCG